MKKTFRLTAQAESELEEVLSYIALESPRAVSLVLGWILLTRDLLQLFPMAGPIVAQRAPLRRIRIRRTNLYLVYEVTEPEIIVHAVLHGAQQWQESE